MSGIVVIGGGHNGLITATLLAKAGRQVTILERSDQVGGCARTTELAPGFHCPTLAHVAALDPALVGALWSAVVVASERRGAVAEAASLLKVSRATVYTNEAGR